jgi:oligoribonuclease NrnB/cAMP/cGMP phosphodiesterase (DHH superfamily)
MNTSHNPLVIYHKNCADGFGAAYACWLKLGDSADYLPLSYGYKREELPSSFEGREVYLVDFSLELTHLAEIVANCSQLFWFDHHKTAFENYVGKLPVSGIYIEEGRHHRIVLDNNRSGALLTYNELFPSKVAPLMLDYIDDYDRWIFTMKDSKAFNKALWAMQPWSFEQWHAARRNITTMVAEGEALLKAHNGHVQSVLPNALPCRIPYPLLEGKPTPIALPHPWMFAGNKWYVEGLALNASSFLTSDAGHELSKLTNTFALIWNMGEKGPNEINCSLRSVPNFDASEVAKAYGGGGHKNACGFSVDMPTLLSFLNEKPH